ncbi:hypothetical protein C8Q74DRAFT_1297932 [Fomes fomentarius]|nr:hypothetical protein C8Q74DRAFT_1297932 [Fomes fomentarius]
MRPSRRNGSYLILLTPHEPAWTLSPAVHNLDRAQGRNQSLPCKIYTERDGSRDPPTSSNNPLKRPLLCVSRALIALPSTRHLVQATSAVSALDLTQNCT